MIIEKTMHDKWLSNTWLVADRPGGHAVIIDTGGPMQSIVEKIAALDLKVTHVLCTHHHWDHVDHNADYQHRYDAPICGHPAEKELFDKLDVELGHGAEVASGDLRVEALHIPGHTVGQLAFVVNGECVFTGDTLFRRSIGGTRGPGHATFDDLRRSIMDVLMALPKRMPAYPGHTDATTIGEEWDENPFIRAWRGIDATDDRKCTAFGQPATLLTIAADYDGGKKAWVRFDEGEMLDVVPGSQVVVSEA